MDRKFLNLNGLTTFYNKLKETFATEAEVTEVEADTKTYVTEIDYDSILGFQTDEIIFDGSESPLLDTGELSMMFLQ